MGRENERKYLVRDDRWKHNAGTGTHYRQGYLCLDPARNVRVRIGGGKAVVTIKGQSEDHTRAEFEYPIPVEDASQILARLCVRPLIEKTRYDIRIGGFTWQVDEFAGENAGLVVAELETDKSEREISRPEWIGQEVTGDPRYFNPSLVTEPYSHWRQPVEN